MLSHSVHGCALLALGAADMFTSSTAGGVLDSRYRQQLTLYHLNPSAYGDTPLNMDTADARGDLFFFFSSLYQPMECKKGGDMSGSMTERLVRAPSPRSSLSIQWLTISARVAGLRERRGNESKSYSHAAAPGCGLAIRSVPNLQYLRERA
jgi:hypothetical protein